MDLITGRPRQLVAAALSIGVIAALVVLLWPEDDAAHAVPYDDARSAGLITLCSDDGTAITGGDVDDRPFADHVVGASGLPSDLDPAGAVGTLYAHQPRGGVGPDEFSGSALTAATLLSDPATPVVAVPANSWSIADFVAAFPADQDGYLQLRLVLGTPAAGTLTEAPYDTADLRVDGDEWELVRGGSAPCTDASPSPTTSQGETR